MIIAYQQSHRENIRVGDKSFELESDDKTLSLSYDQVKSALVNVSFK